MGKKKNQGEQGGGDQPPNPQGGNQNKSKNPPQQQQPKKVQQQEKGSGDVKPQQFGDQRVRPQPSATQSAWGPQTSEQKPQQPSMAIPPQQQQHQKPPGFQSQQPTQQWSGQQQRGNPQQHVQQQQRPPGFQSQGFQAAQPPVWGNRGDQQQQQRPQQNRPNPPQHTQAQPPQQPSYFAGQGAPQQQQRPQQNRPNQPAPPQHTQAQPPQQQPSYFAGQGAPQQQTQRPQMKGNPKKQQQQQPSGDQQAGSNQPEPVRASSSTSSIDKGLSSMQLAVKSTPNNMRFGTKGRPCKLKANYLPIKFNNLPGTVYHYDLRFEPDVAKKFFSSAVDELMKKHFKDAAYAHDGRSNLYTAKELVMKGPSLEDTVTAVIGERSKEYKLKIQFARKIDMTGLKNIVVPTGTDHLGFDQKPLLAITALNIIIRKCFKRMIQEKGAVSVASSLYVVPARPELLGEGLELWYGLFQSVIMGQKCMYLNVDVSHKAFPSPIAVLDVLKSYSRDGQLPRAGDRCFDTLQSHLKMLEVVYDRKSYRFDHLANSAKNEMFEMTTPQGPKKISVFDYLRGKKIELRYPEYPCLALGANGRIVVPLERCSIAPGQATNKKTSGRVTASIIKYSATSTDAREAKIKNLLSNVNYTSDLKDFGIEINKEFELVDGRVIDPPRLKYAGNVVDVRKGVWQGSNFLETPQHASINWAIICCDDYVKQNELQDVKRTILDAARRKRIMLDNEPLIIESLRLNDRDFERKLEEKFRFCSKNKDRTIVFVIIQDRNDNYAKVKQTAEQKVGILTQCIKSSTLRRLPGMTMDNILLKVNAKLSGKNHEIVENAFNKNTGVMFVGADVTHAGPDQRDIPSVVGVVSSYDQVGFKYQCSWRLQKKVKRDNQIEEMILDLENVIVEHLTRYKNQNKQLPLKIMYYRDGVSEGQFKEVLQIELNAIRKAMTRMYGPETSKHAKVTFIVVQKRHHTRFFPTQKQFMDGKFNNIMPGTVVDKDIVDPYTFQFFLASHAAIQGVTKPAKYCILLNESNFNADDLQAITYDLCHLFTRCNRSVSYPAPTYYAHLVAARGKQYIIGSRLNMSNMMMLEKEYKKREIDATFNKTFPMFFV